ncbi:MAG: UvrD-helicase domain-containing protein [Acidiferrobacter sp.]
MSDAHARATAINPAQSFIVQAPAGSGKTELLIQRYLALLAQVDAPEEIVALTFTRKAAAEMQARVLAALTAVDGPSADTAHGRQTQALAAAAARRAAARGWQLTQCPGRLRIDTFDALCLELVRQSPVGSGVGAPLAVTDAPTPLYEEAAYATFLRIDGEDAAATALANLLPALANDVDAFVRLVADLLSRREQWLPQLLGATDAPSGDARTLLETALRAPLIDTVARLQVACPPSLHAVLCALGAANSDGTDWTQRLNGDAAALPLWQQLADLTLTKADQCRQRCGGLWPDGWGTFAEFHDALQAAPAFTALLVRLRALGPGTYSDAQWQRLAALTEILPVAAAQLLLVFSHHGVWDFTEVALRALAALGGEQQPSTLALRLDFHIHHLLIDEFQDTSVLQYRLLAQLTAGWNAGDGRTLFVVGDPMQSIYGFRKAEVGLFMRLASDGLGNLPITPLCLTRNFRARATITDWVNQTFAQILPATFDGDDGGVPYVRAEAAGDAGGEVQVHALGGADLAAEAAYVAQLVGDLCADADNATIAVLVATRTHGHAVAAALATAGIACAAVDLYGLKDRTVIRDLMALTEVLVLPASRLATLACLRAPWCGLDLADLAVLAQGEERLLAMLLAKDDGWPGVSASGHLRIRRVQAALHGPLATRGRDRLVRRVEQAWHALGGPAVLDGVDDVRDAEAFFAALAALEQAGEVDLWALQARIEALYAPSDASMVRVQILTIHKAKGLEFDAVVLPALSRSGRPDTKPLLLALERTTTARSDLLLAPLKSADDRADPLYDGLWGLHRRRQAHERGRLLYVACTRARRALHLVGHYPLGTAEWRPAAALKTLWPALAEAFMAAARPTAPPPPGVQAAPPGRLPLTWVAPPASTPILGPPVGPAMAIAPPVFDWASTRIRWIGIAVHALFARLATTGLPPPGSPVTAFTSYARGLLQSYGLAGSELKAALATVMQALVSALNDPTGRWLLGPQHDAHNEWTLGRIVDGVVHQIRIDRTFIDGDGTRWIVDYKTGMHEGAGLDAFLDAEQERYRPQLDEYGQWLAVYESRPIELALYFPLLKDWRHWRYVGDQAAARAEKSPLS